MSGFVVGMQPGEVYTSDEHLALGFAIGTKGTDSNGKEFVMTVVAASQNLVNGQVVGLIPGAGTAAYTATVLASASPVPGTGNMLAVVVCSVTASASAYIWVQVYGSCQILVTDTTASNLPGHLLTPSSVPGSLRGGLATASSFVDGLVLTATGSTAALTAAFLSYPHLTAG